MSNDAAQEYANDLIEREYGYARTFHLERFLKLTDQEKAEFENRIRKEAEELAQSILDKSPEWVKRVASGQLHPSNGRSRRLFSALTGIKLPSTVKGTKEAVHSYMGQELDDYFAAKEAERVEKARAKSEKEAQRQKESLAASLKALKNKERLGPEQLIEVARHLGVNIHPRTVGAIRKHLIEISDYITRVRKQKTRMPQTVWGVYRECLKKVSE